MELEVNLQTDEVPQSKFGLYIKERLNKHIVENRYGFATYLFEADYVYVEDVYVDKAYRQTNKASNMLDEIAEIANASGIKKMITTVSPSAIGATNSLKAILGYGFELLNCDTNAIYFIKKIGE